jgi:predicted DNA-binding transcriptional regulator
MNRKFKEASILFFIQILLYGLLCINYRAIAEIQYHWAALSDFAVASLNFFVIRKISKGEEALHQWTGYVLGSVVGSYLGIYISTLIH